MSSRSELFAKLDQSRILKIQTVVGDHGIPTTRNDTVVMQLKLVNNKMTTVSDALKYSPNHGEDLVF